MRAASRPAEVGAAGGGAQSPCHRLLPWLLHCELPRNANPLPDAPTLIFYSPHLHSSARPFHPDFLGSSLPQKPEGLENALNMTRLSSLLTHCTALLRLDHFFCISSTPEQRAGNLRTAPITKPLRIKTKGETASTCFPLAKAAKIILSPHHLCFNVTKMTLWNQKEPSCLPRFFCYV